MSFLKGKEGDSIRLITKKIEREVKEEMRMTKRNIDTKKSIKDSFKSGKLDVSDWKYIMIGLQMLSRIIDSIWDKEENRLLLGENDVSEFRQKILEYRFVMDDVFRRIVYGAREEYEFQQKIKELDDFEKIIQAARDGTILKKVSRKEIVNGKLKEITYDEAMSSQEVFDTLNDYKHIEDRMQGEKINNYLTLGLALAGMLGTIFGKSNVQKTEISWLSIGTVTISGLRLIKGILEERDKKELWHLHDEQNRLRSDLFGIEQISSDSKKDIIRIIKDKALDEKSIGIKMDNKSFIFDATMDLIYAIIAGVYLHNNVIIKENGKIDGKSLASALISLESVKGVAGEFLDTVRGIQENRKNQIEFKELCQKVDNIISQMEEKIYPLEGAKDSFDSIVIHDFKGRFYPRKNYETGEIEYSTIITIPEFSMKRGDIVLLSGESGSGKSTFLRLLKRGDINNRSCIELSNGQKVDYLGDEYISFRPSINLGDERSVLSQITGKTSISDLDESEKDKLLKIISQLQLDKKGELQLDSDDVLNQLATKKFMEFSTGQQRRLALSKLFYRIDDGTSVIIVDEPVGNVEDELIREQLKMIKRYAASKNVMLLLTTHRLDLAEDLATKRYRINKEGVMEEIPVLKKSKDDTIRN